MMQVEQLGAVSGIVNQQVNGLMKTLSQFQELKQGRMRQQKLRKWISLTI